MSRRIQVSRAARGPLKNGHPWLFQERGVRVSAGEVVTLEDDQKAPLAWGLADEGPIQVRVLGRGRAPNDVERVIAERIHRADQVRQRLLTVDTDGYRVVGGAGDGLPGLVIDRYADLAVVRIYGKCWEPYVEAVIRGLKMLPWLNHAMRRFGVSRVDGREGGEAWIGAIPDTVIMQEHGMRLLVRPLEGQKTGLFLDQREHRHLVRGWANGRVVANLFAYNGGFSVAAALGGASFVSTVDIAPDAVEDAKENFRLNGLDPDQHAFEVADVFKWKPVGKVDMLIVDPPSLAKGKKAEAAALSAYRKLHRSLGGSVSRDGLLCSSSCTARLSIEGWRRAIREGLSSTGDWSWHWVSAAPPDHPVALTHPEGEYLKFALLRRR